VIRIPLPLVDACRRALVLVPLLCAIDPPAAWADDSSAPPESSSAPPEPSSTPPQFLPEIVVVGTRLPTPEDQLGSSVTVITSDEIERKQERTLPDVLQDVPGLNLVQTGSPGGVTSVFMRGTNSNHVKVFVDGIDVSDPASPNGAVDFSQFLASDIERVEVLRGPQSGLYGSDAIGGVINIITKQGSGPPEVHGSVEGGSFDTFNQTVGTSGSIARFSYAFDIGHYYSDDTPVTPANLVPPGVPINGDSYDNETYSTKLNFGVTDNFSVGLVARYVTTSLVSTSDDPVTGNPEALPSASDNREFFTRATAHLVVDDTFDQTLGLAYTYYRLRFLDPNPDDIALGGDPSLSHGDRIKADWQGNITLVPGQIVTLGAEHEIDGFDSNSPPAVEAQMIDDAGFAQLQSSFGERLFNAASIRLDENDRFGSAFTYREAPAFLIPETGTRFKGSVGTGFKAPTLEDLFQSFPAFDFFANPNLKPETNLGWDGGFEQALLARRLQFGATYFHNDIKNLIQTNDAGTTDVNIGRATTYGAETFISYTPWDPVTFRADYTYTFAEDDIAHQELLERPKHKASLNATWQVTPVASLSATVLYVGSWIDINRNGTETGLTAHGYTVVNLAGSYDLGHGVAAFVRVNNLLDREYQDPLGFQHQGLGVFGGVRFAFNLLSGGGS
jgi:vitamin B12 transporter